MEFVQFSSFYVCETVSLVHFGYLVPKQTCLTTVEINVSVELNYIN